MFCNCLINSRPQFMTLHLLVNGVHERYGVVCFVARLYAGELKQKGKLILLNDYFTDLNKELKIFNLVLN